MDRGAWWAMVHKLAMSHLSSIINSMFLWIWVEMCIHILCLYVEKQMMNSEKLKYMRLHSYNYYRFIH